jgi:hypothetical protein
MRKRHCRQPGVPGHGQFAKMQDRAQIIEWRDLNLSAEPFANAFTMFHLVQRLLVLCTCWQVCITSPHTSLPCCQCNNSIPFRFNEEQREAFGTQIQIPPCLFFSQYSTVSTVTYLLSAVWACAAAVTFKALEPWHLGHDARVQYCSSRGASNCT